MELMKSSYTEYLKIQEQRIIRHENSLKEINNKYQVMLDSIYFENDSILKENNKNWDQKCQSLEQKIRTLQLSIQDYMSEIKRQRDNLIHLESIQAEELRNNEISTFQDQYNQYKAVLKVLEAKLHALDESIVNFNYYY